MNITRIESRPVSSSRFDFFVDFRGRVSDSNVSALLDHLRSTTDRLLVLDAAEVHWFPRHVSELDLVANRTLDAGTDLEADHPGFRDEEYRRRRARLARLAMDHRHGMPLPRTEYTDDEVKTWGLVWDTMEGLWDQYACKEYKVSRKYNELWTHFCSCGLRQLYVDNAPPSQRAEINEAHDGELRILPIVHSAAVDGLVIPICADRLPPPPRGRAHQLS